MAKSQQVAVQEPERAVFQIEGEGKETESNEIEAIEDEEQAQVPARLSNMYQPTRSACLGHIVTHYPFRAWCHYCLEGADNLGMMATGGRRTFEHFP